MTFAMLWFQDTIYFVEGIYENLERLDTFWNTYLICIKFEVFLS